MSIFVSVPSASTNGQVVVAELLIFRLLTADTVEGNPIIFVFALLYIQDVQLSINFTHQYTKFASCDVLVVVILDNDIWSKSFKVAQLF